MILWIRTKEFLEKKEKNQGIKIFQQELTKSINREDGIYKSPKVKVFELPDSKRVFNKDANVTHKYYILNIK